MCGIDQATIHQNLTVRQAHDQATVYDTFEMNTIGDFPGCRQNLAGKFHFAHAQSAALPSPPNQPR